MGMSPDELKLAPITAISSSSMRAKDWEDVLTAHAEERGARTWRVLDGRIGAWVLDMDQGAVQVCTKPNYLDVCSRAGRLRHVLW